MSGAIRDEWQRFTRLGLTADMLPVVSDTSVPIGANSTMKALGKTPSLVKGDGTAVGLAKWTQRVATADDLAIWQRDARHGICLQTRVVRAIDIDVPDPAIADAIEAVVVSALDGIALPKRFRRDSGKRLLAFRYLSPMPKRVLGVDGGIVEILGDGQQFIAAGTHPAGARYEWDSQSDFPVLDDAQLAAVHRALETVFGDEKGWRIAREKREGVALEGLEYCDEFALWLADNWEIYSATPEGFLNLRCPFEDEHTSESGETATSYRPAGSGGFERGHMICLHAHCEGRALEDYWHKTGFVGSAFKALAVVEPEAAPEVEIEETWPRLERDGKFIAALADNINKALTCPSLCGIVLAYDTFEDAIVWHPYKDKTKAWRSFSDHHYIDLRISLERRGFRKLSKDALRDGVAHAARQGSIDTAQIWLSSLKWDGTPRIERFMETYFGVDDHPYIRAVSLYIWSALAGRVMVPGIQADMAPIFYGAQGARKTTAIKAISPFDDAFTEIDIGERDADLSRKLRGKLVGELSELRGMGTKDGEAIKAWISRTHEEWIPKFKEFGTKFPRRLVFFGSTNNREFLGDETGERRWLPVTVAEGGRIDPEGVARDREQLWAEGAMLFNLDGIQYQEAEALARHEHIKYKIVDVWHPIIARWLGDHASMGGAPMDRPEGVCVSEIIDHALLMLPSHGNSGVARRVTKVLRAMNWTSRISGPERSSRWFPPLT